MIQKINVFLLENLDKIAYLAEIIGVIFVAYTLLRDRKIKKIEFASDHNFHFISSGSLVDFERKLEGCNQKYNFKERSGYFKTSKSSLKKYRHTLKLMDAIMDVGQVQDSSEPVTKKYQEMVNYLVYLESFAPLLLKKQVRFQDVDDLFGYRFFIAMNNPIVQARELLPEAMYYRGCIKLYKRWYQYRKKRKLVIPMDYFSLVRWKNDRKENINPVFEHDQSQELLNNYLKIAHPFEWKKRLIVRSFRERLNKNNVTNG